jgi:ureidoacrylate peracid hydrolase
VTDDGVTLRDALSPATTALVVVDVQNDFVCEGGASHAAGRPVARLQTILSPLAAALGAARVAGVRVVYVTSIYGGPDSPYLSATWYAQAARRGERRYVELPMCAEGSWGGGIVAAVAPQPGDVTVRKHRFSGFHGTGLDDVLRAHGTRTVLLAGVLTHVCVHATAIDAFSRDYTTFVVEDCVADWTDEMHAAGLRMIDTLYGRVVSLAHVRDVWVAPGARVLAAAANRAPR